MTKAHCLTKRPCLLSRWSWLAGCIDCSPAAAKRRKDGRAHEAYSDSIYATILARSVASGRRPRMAPRLSAKCFTSLVPGMTAVTRESPSKYFRKNCAQLLANSLAQSGTALPWTARNKRPRPNGTAVNTPDFTSAASGRIHFSAPLSSIE